MKSSDETQRLAALYSLRILDTEPDKRFNRFVRLAQRAFSTPICLISFMDETRQWIKTGVGLSVSEIPREASYCDVTIQSTDHLYVPDTLTDVRLEGRSFGSKHRPIRFYIGIPLRSVDGYNVGTLSLMDYVPRKLDAADIDLLHDLRGLVEETLHLQAASGQAVTQASLENGDESSDYKRMLRAIWESEQRAGLLVQQTPLAVIEYDLDFKITAWNPAAERIFGYSKNDAIGRNGVTLLAEPHRHDDIRGLFRGLLSDNRRVAHDTAENITSDGRKIYCAWYNLCLVSEDGDVVGLAALAQDITEQMKLENTLRDNEANLKTLIENTHDAIWSVDVQYRLVTINSNFRRACEIAFGVTPSIGENILNIMPRPRALIWKERYDRALRGERFNAEEAYHIGEQIRIYEISLSPIKQNEVVRGVTVYSRDVTQRKRSEKELRESENQKRAILNTLPDIMFRFDRDGRYVDVATAEEASLGVGRDHKIGKTLYDIIPESVADGYIEKINETLDTGRLQKYEYHLTVQNQLKYYEAHMTAFDSHEVIAIVRDVTDRKIVEQQVRSSEAQKRAILNALPDIMIRFGQDGRYIEIATAAEDELVAPVDAMIGRSVAELLPEPVASAFIDYIERTLATGESQNFEYELELQNSTNYFEARLAVLNDAEVIAVVRNITDRKKAERLRQESEARFRAISEATPVPIAITRADDGRYLYTNHAHNMMLNLSQADIAERTSRDFYFKDDDRTKMIASLIRDGVLVNREVRLKRGDGTPFWALLSIVPITFDGEPALLCGLADIHHRKLIEQRVRQQNNYMTALHKIAVGLLNRLELRDVLENIAIYAQQILDADDATLVLADEQDDTIEHVIGTSLSEMIVRRRFATGLARRVWLENRSIVVRDYSTWEERLPNSSYDNAHFTVGTPLWIDSAVIGILIVSSTDPDRLFTEEEITIIERFASLASVALDNARLFNESLEAKDAAEAANRAKSAFLANMSHELRTPLNAILGFAQILLRDTSTTEKQRENLNIITTSGEHLLQLINDVLEMSKIEAGRIAVNMTSFNLYLLLDTLEEMMRFRAVEKNLMLSAERTDDVPQYIYTDQNKLRQILINLLSNAVKYTQAGTITLRTSVGHETSPPTLRFEVEDTGQGISEDEMNLLFEAFIQTESGRKVAEGTGLGLPISRKFAQLLGGDVVVESEPNVGSIFTATIIYETASSVEVEGVSDTRRVVALEAGQKPLKILVAEDQDISRLLICNLLEPVGFEVRQVVNGKEAVDQSLEWEPDLIFMDMRMPIMDGYEATRQIKATSSGDKITIVALTASAFEHERLRCLDAGCDDFIRKPYREHDIFQSIARLKDVRFIYESSTPSMPADETKTRAILRESIEELPKEWVSALDEAAVSADIEASLTAIERIHLQNAHLAEHLTDLVNNFQFSTILKLTKISENA